MTCCADPRCVWKLVAAHEQLGPNAQAILVRLASRLVDGHGRYGDFAAGREWGREAVEELLDGAVYLEAQRALREPLP